MFRAKDPARAAKIAQAMKAACANDRIGYDQWQRDTLYDLAKNVRYIGITGDMANIDKVQLELGSAATEYEPYQGDTFTADFGQTVYGGTLDWNTGVLTATHGQIAAYAGESLPGAWISDRDVYADGAMPTTGAQVVYKLATPTTIQLTPQGIAAMEGLNSLYSSTGDTEVAGRTDMGWLTQGILDRLAALESAAVSE